jgi:hypothetical protein
LTAIDLEEGVTCTVATGPGVTFKVPLPDCPSLVAVMLAEPTTNPVATPAAVTVATAVLLDAQVTVRPVSKVPFASLRVAVKFEVDPLWTLALAGETVTVATGAMETVTVAVPDFPSLVAVMVDVPTVNPVTRPADVTLATSRLLELHVTTRLVTTRPLTSFTVAVNGVVPAMKIEAVGGVTVTVPTGASVTVIAELPTFPSLVAVIIADPDAPPVTRPVEDTLATLGLFDAHVTTRSVTTVPFWSFTVAVSCVV